MKWMRSVAAACALAALGAGDAQALTTNWGPHDLVELGSGLLFAPGAFEDRFEFSLASGPLVLTAVSNDLEPIFNVTSGLVELFTSGGTLIGSLAFDSTAVSATFTPDPGDYYYRVTGDVTGSAGSYLVSSAIPEPGTAALLAAGMIGIAARARRTRR